MLFFFLLQEPGSLRSDQIEKVEAAIARRKLSCGQHCVWYCLQRFDQPVTFAEVERSLPLTDQGVSVAAMVEQLRSHGLPAMAVKLPADDPARLPFPAVAVMGGRHVIVVEGFDRNKQQVRAFDPTYQNWVYYPLKFFEERWSGLAIVFAPPQPSRLRLVLWAVLGASATLGLLGWFTRRRTGFRPQHTPLSPPSARGEARSAFSLVELLVVIAILVLLLGLLLPAIQRVRGQVDQMICASRLRALGQALHGYHADRQALPAGCTYQGGSHPQPHLSWLARILPYLGEDELWRQTQAAFQAEPFFLKPPHGDLRGRQLRLFTCPSDDRLNAALLRLDIYGNTVPTGYTSYLGVGGTNQFAFDGLLYLDSKVRFSQVEDGLSATLLAGERPPPALLNAGWWYAGWGMAKNGAGEMHLGVREVNAYPADYYYGQGRGPGPFHFQRRYLDEQQGLFHFWSLHSGGAHFLFGDTTVRFLKYDADPLLPALATRAGKEPISLGD